MSTTSDLLSLLDWEYLFGSDGNEALALLQAQKPQPAFASEAVALCQAVSHSLTHDARARVFPDLMALGYALRYFYSSDFVAAYNTQSKHTAGVRLGRGLAFHFAPNNVETLFLYSLFLSIMAGNTNIVRLGNKQSVEQQLLLSILKEVLQQPEHQLMAQRLMLVRYGHDDELNALFSGMCALRVIWGGNDTIEHLRSIAIPAGASELAFAHKFSWAVLSAEAVRVAAEQDELRKLAQGFVTDAFSFGQQACSSPGLIVWLGRAGQVQTAQLKFWEAVDVVLKSRAFELSAAQVSERFTKVCQMSCVTDTPLQLNRSADLKSYLRLQLGSWSDLAPCRALHGGNGVFLEIITSTMEDALSHCSGEEQTITSFGISADEWNKAVVAATPQGLHRIVPVGQALTFNSVWDGHDLIVEMSRKLTVIS